MTSRRRHRSPKSSRAVWINGEILDWISKQKLERPSNASQGHISNGASWCSRLYDLLLGTISLSCTVYEEIRGSYRQQLSLTYEARYRTKNWKVLLRKAKSYKNRYQWHEIVFSSASWKWSVESVMPSDRPKLSAKNNRGRLLHDCPTIVQCNSTLGLSS